MDQSPVGRVVAFLRPLLPHSPIQIAILLGVLLLYCAPFMTWWVPPSWDVRALISVEPAPQITWPISFLALRMLSFLSIIAGFSSIILCFGSPTRPGRFYAIWIVPFTGLMLLLVAFNHLFSRTGVESIFDDVSTLAVRVLERIPTLFSHAGPGFFAGTLGLTFVGIGVWAHARKGHLLPVGFAGEQQAEAPNARRKEILRFVLLVYALSLASHLVLGLLGIAAFELGLWEPKESYLYATAIGMIGSTLPVAMVGLWYLRKEGQWRRLFGPVAPKFLLISVGIPLAAYALPRVAIYCGAEVAHYFNPLGFAGPPPFLSLFTFPGAWGLVFLLPALLEEIGWRGYLQQRMVAEFGMRRGLLLLGLAWAVWHLHGEVSSSEWDWAFVAILVRFASIFSILVPLGWLFWKTGSVIPVAILHALSNALPSGSNDWQGWNLGIGEWVVMAACGYWLFKRWPAQTLSDPSAVNPEPSPEAAGVATEEVQIPRPPVADSG